MYIYEHMTSDPITIAPTTLLPEARRILGLYQIRHLPVVDGQGRLIGIVSDRDLRSAYPSTVLSKAETVLAYEHVEKTEVAEIMATACATLTAEASIDDALVLFDRDKIGGIPVVSEENVVIGFFSLLDLTAAYRKLFGVAEEGSVLVGIVDDGRSDLLSALVTLLEQNGVVLTRLIRLAEKRDEARVFLRMTTKRPAEVCRLLRSGGFKLLVPPPLD